jgi:cytochrome c biogenesis protein CcmG, thiol:disulfide interchange protein DsbE
MMRMTLVLFAALTAGCAATPRAAAPTTTSATPGAVTVGQPLPELGVHDLKGQPLALGKLRGRVVLIDLWASWCTACKEELPLLDQLAGRLDARGVSVVAVSLDEDRGAAEEFLKLQQAWRLQIAHDPAGKVAQILQPEKMPSSYVLDRQGVLRQIHVGFEHKDAARLEAELSALAGD